MDPDAPWLLDDDTSSTPSAATNDAALSSGFPDGSSAPEIPTGPPVPNPYAHVVSVSKMLIFNNKRNFEKLSHNSKKALM